MIDWNWRRFLGLDRGEHRAGRSLFFNRFWLQGAAIVLIAGVATGHLAISLIGLLFLASAAVTVLWNRQALSDLTCIWSVSSDRALPGDEIELTISIANHKALPIPWITIDADLPETIEPTDRPTLMTGATGRRTLRLATSLLPFERVTWRIPVICRARGAYELGPATIRAGDPFGFFSSRITIVSTRTILVYPRLFPIADLGFPHRYPLGATRSQRQLITDPSRIIGVREYRPDDPFRSMHWKATARHGTPHVRIAEPVTDLTLHVLTSVETFNHYWEGLDLRAAEQALEVTAAVSAWALQERYAVGVAVNGLLAHSDQSLRIPAGRGPAQLPTIMTGLARISLYSTLPIDRLIRSEAGRMHRGSTVVIITPILSEAAIGQIAALIARGHHVVLVPIGDCRDPGLRGLVARPLTIADDRWEMAA